MQQDEITYDTQMLRAQMMRCMPAYQREVAIRGGERLGIVIDARARFYRDPKIAADPYCDGDTF